MMNAASYDNELSRATLHGFGLPAERLARVAARRAFVELKHTFMRAVADIDGSTGELLQRRVRQAGEAIELWRIGALVLASLPSHDERAACHRIELHRQLDSVFPDNTRDTAVVPL